MLSQLKKRHEEKYVLKKADIDFYKMTGVFAIACVFVLLVIKMKDTGLERIASGKNLTYNFYTFCHTPLFGVVAAIAFAAALGWFLYSRIKKVDESHRIFTSTNCLSVVLYLLFFSACFGSERATTLHSFFVISTICLALLYYASKIYKPDFIVYSIVNAVMAVTTYLWAMRFEAHIVVIKLIIAAAGVVFVVFFKRKLAELKVTKHTKASFMVFPCYIALVLGIIFMFWAYIQTMPVLFKIQSAIFLNRSMMLALIFAQYIVFAIIYTVKRIKD